MTLTPLIQQVGRIRFDFIFIMPYTIQSNYHYDEYVYQFFAVYLCCACTLYLIDEQVKWPQVCQYELSSLILYHPVLLTHGQRVIVYSELYIMRSNQMWCGSCNGCDTRFQACSWDGKSFVYICMMYNSRFLKGLIQTLFSHPYVI